MARILSIETSGGITSAAVGVDGVCVAIQEAAGNEQSHRLTLMIQQVLNQAGLSSAADLDAVAVSAGPGSYTGLRIGVSVAKGICFAAEKPLIAISTTDALARGALISMSQAPSPKSRLVAMIDARRMEIYTARYDVSGARFGDIEAVVVDEHTFDDLRDAGENVVIFGSGAEKCKPYIEAELVEVPLSARWLVAAAEEKFIAGQFQDVAYFEPEYIKEFVALTSQKKLF